MKQRPWPIIILAVAHLLAPVGNLFISSYVNSIGIYENLVDRFHPENWGDTFIFFLLPILSGVMIYICRKWSYFAYLALMSYMIVSSTIFWHEQMGFLSVWPLVMLYIVNIGVVGYFLIPAVRSLYFDPRLRWWESKPRYHFERECEVIVGEQKTKGTIKNISEGGAFVIVEKTPKDESTALILFENDGVRLEVSAQVIIHDKTQEMGFGARFQHTDVTLKQVQDLVQKLHKEGKILQNRRPSPEDAIQYWAKQVVTFKGGLVPNIKK